MKITVLTQHLCTAHGGSHTTLHDTHVPQTDPLQPEPDANAAPCRHGKRLPPGDSRDSDDSCEKKRDLYTDQFHTLHTSQELEIASGTLNKPFVPVRTLTTSTTCLPPRGGTAAKAGGGDAHADGGADRRKTGRRGVEKQDQDPRGSRHRVSVCARGKRDEGVENERGGRNKTRATASRKSRRRRRGRWRSPAHPHISQQHACALPPLVTKGFSSLFNARP